MPTLPIGEFHGLDFRRNVETWAGHVRLIAGSNVMVAPGGTLQTRPQLRFVAQLDSTSLGLYVVGHQLHAAYPQGSGAVPRPPEGFEYDVFSDAATAGTDGVGGSPVELANVALWKTRPYLVIGRLPPGATSNNRKYEHHFMPPAPYIPIQGTVSGSTLTVLGARSPQTINFAPVALTIGVGGTPSATLSATASSGLTCTFTLLSGPATLVGTTLTATSSGTIVVQAVQSGNTTYAPASSTQTIQVVAVGATPVLSQRIIFTPVSAVLTPQTLTATTTSGQPCTFSIVSGTATLTGSSLTLTGEGSVTIRATQSGSAGYSPATADQTVNVVIPPGVTTGATLYFTNMTDPTPRTITVSGSTITLSSSTTLTGPVVAMVRPYTGTKVGTPYTPGRALTLIGTKLFASDTDTNNVPFSSSINGPSDWTNPGDAGVLPTSVHTGGDQSVQGLGVFNGQLTVFYDTSLQVWRVGADPVNHALVGSVGSAGTRMPRSITNVLGDVFYFSDGGFHSVSTVVVTGQLKPDDIGVFVRDQTRKIDPRSQTMISGWSVGLSSYYNIVNDPTTGTAVMWVYTLSPMSKTADWSTWQLPIAVADTAEREGLLYLRTPTGAVWVFDPDYLQESNFTWSATTNFMDAHFPRMTMLDMGFPLREKMWRAVRGSQVGTARWAVCTDPSNIAGSQIALGTVSGTFNDHGLLFIGVAANRLAFQWSGTGFWKLDEMHVDIQVGNYV